MQKQIRFYNIQYQEDGAKDANETTEQNHKQIKLAYDNISFLKVIEEKASGEMTLGVVYRKKASFKEFQFKIKIPNQEKSKFFSNHSMYRLENYYINTQKVQFVDFETEKNKTSVEFYFVDGMQLKLNTLIPRWNAWKDTRL